MPLESWTHNDCLKMREVANNTHSKRRLDNNNNNLVLAREIVNIWAVDWAIIVPIVVSAYGLLPKSFDQHLK